MIELPPNSVKFLEAIPDIERKDWGKEFIVKCPVCGGDFHAIRVKYNGHLRAWCHKCDFQLIE